MVVHNGGRIYKEFDKYDKFKIGYREEDHQLYLEYNDIVKTVSYTHLDVYKRQGKR